MPPTGRNEGDPLLGAQVGEPREVTFPGHLALIGGWKLGDGAAAALGGGLCLLGGATVVSAPAHQVGADAKAGGAHRMRKTDPGARKGGLSGHEEEGREEISLLLHLLVPDAAAPGADGGSGLVFKEQMGQFVGEGVGQPAVGVRGVEDDEARGADEDGAGGEAPVVDDGELPDRRSARSLGGQVVDRDDGRAVVGGQGAGVEAVVGTEVQLGSDGGCETFRLSGESSAHDPTNVSS